MMAETCLLAEAAICYPPLYDELRNVTARPTETVETVAFAAVAAASEQGASAILVLSTSGNTARLISKYRPSVPIVTGRYINSFSRDPVIDQFFSDPKRADLSSDTPSQGGVSSLVYRASRHHEPAVASGRMWSSHDVHSFQLIDCWPRWTIVSDLDYAMLFPWA
jgi:hypothetical protein